MDREGGRAVDGDPGVSADVKAAGTLGAGTSKDGAGAVREVGTSIG